MSEYTEVDDAIAKIEETAKLLQSSNEAMANHLMQLVNGMSNWYTTKENLYKFKGLCHPKALGDNIVELFDMHSWSKQIDELHDKCAIAFSLLEGFNDNQKTAFNNTP